MITAKVIYNFNACNFILLISLLLLNINSLLFIIIINLFHNLIIKNQNTLNCESKYNECFNCSVCGVEETCNCNWDKNTKTCKTGLDKILSLDFYNSFTTCSDDNSKTIIEKYCGNTILEVDDNMNLNSKCQKILVFLELKIIL